MKYCAVIVEGQSEERFVSSVLAPLLRSTGVFLQPIIVRTKETPTRVFKGGGKWASYRDLAVKLLKQPHWDVVGILFDVYGRPAGTPCGDHTLTGKALQQSIRESIEAELSKVDGGQGRIIAGPVLFEFETLVLAAIATGLTTAPKGAVDGARHAIQRAGSIEAVNEGPNTSPSKRLQQWWPQYQKVIDGPALIAEVSFELVLDACPTFLEWLDRLLAAAEVEPF